MYTREQIEQVRSSSDIVEVVRDYVPSLKASGRTVRGLCPFHSERTPSFHVHPEKGMFKCFGCGEGGDVITFLSKMEQISFTESLEMLASRAGIRLEKERSAHRLEPEGIKEKIFRLLESTRNFYEDRLWDEREGKTAREYLEKRGIREDTIREFHLGFAPTSSTSAFETLVKKGFPIELCQQAGLVSRSAAGRYYDPMFGRVVFPILDSFGHVIGFGGRTLPEARKARLGDVEGEGDSGPKYLNSPETPVFSKGRSLYGLFQAKSHILSSRRAVILEGYMDVVGVYQAGVKNVVATLGTAFTRDHAKVLKRYAGEITAFFDPDEAGHTAAVRSLAPMLQEDFFPRVVVTEEKGDPDEIIQEKGQAYFESLVNNAPDFVDFILQGVGTASSLALPEKTKVAGQLLEIIAQAPNEILKAEWASRVARRLGLSGESLERELKRKEASLHKTERNAVSAPAARVRRVPSAEGEYLRLLMAVPGTWSDDLEDTDFLNAQERRLFVLLKEQITKTGKISVPSLYEDVVPEDKDWLIQLSLEEIEFSDPLERRDQLIRDIRIKRVKERFQELSRRIASQTANAVEAEEYQELLRQIKGSRPTAA